MCPKGPSVKSFFHKLGAVERRRNFKKENTVEVSWSFGDLEGDTASEASLILYC